MMRNLLSVLGIRRISVKGISLTVSVAGIAVMLGWSFDIPVLKSLCPDCVSMKFDTAVCFFLSGMTLYFIARASEGEIDKAQMGTSITSLILLLIMGTLFFSNLLGIQTGVEELFFRESHPSAMTVIPGRPSMPTMINFILMALAGILTMLNFDRFQPRLRVIGLIVAASGGLAVIGYCFNIPVFYYYVEGVNAAMAVHTAVLFVLLGIGLLCL